MALILQTRLPSVQLGILKCALPSADFGAPKCTRPSTELGVHRFARPSTELAFPKCPRPYVALGTHCCALSGLAFRIRSRQRRDSTGSWKHVGGSSPVRLAARGAVRASAMKAERMVVELEGKRLSKLHSEINKTSKWIAVVLTAVTVVWRHDDAALWAIIGAVANGLFGQFLKHIINESRPPTADGVKEDPGMPSSHAQGFSFLSTYGALALLLWKGTHFWTVLSATSIILVTIYLSWLRIAEGLHTHAQVIVGSVLGSTGAMCWLWIWKTGVESSVDTFPFLRIILVSLFGIGCFLTYVTNCKHWEFGKH